jgi:hypothetical protein
MGIKIATLARAKADFCARYKDQFNCRMDRDGAFVYSMAARLWEECQRGLELADKERANASSEVAQHLLGLLPKGGLVPVEEVRESLDLAISRVGPMQ